MANHSVSVKLDRIRTLINERGLSVNALERKAKLKNGTIRKWDKACPTIASLVSVGEVLGIDYTNLIEIKKIESEEDENV